MRIKTIPIKKKSLRVLHAFLLIGMLVFLSVCFTGRQSNAEVMGGRSTHAGSGIDIKTENTALIYVRGIIIEVTNHQAWMDEIKSGRANTPKTIYYIDKK